MIVAIFQVCDGIQVTIGGVLRGLGISRPVFIASTIGYWFFGLPIGLYLAYSKGFGAIGLWSGLAISLISVAVILSFVLYRKLKTLEAEIKENLLNKEKLI